MIPRKSPPRSRKPLPRTAPLRKANRKLIRANSRERAQKQRREFERVYGSEERIVWVRGLPSVVSGNGPCVGHHVKNGGKGRKADARWIVPLTPAEHEALHHMGAQSFETKYGVKLERKAEETESAWAAFQEKAP